MNKAFLPFIFFIFVYAAGVTEISAKASTPRLSDSELEKLAYSESAKYPPGFYRENPDSLIFYEHVSHKPLFTNDKDEALKWSEASGKSSSEPTVLAESRETNKYFEFKRVDPKTGQSILSRVHKSSYYEGCYPYNCPQDNGTEMIGYLKFRPMTQESVKEFVEYLWHIKYLDYSGPRALSSSIRETPEGYTQTVKVLSFGKGDWGLPDSIGLGKEIFYIDKRSGEVRRRFKTIKSIRGRHNPSPKQNS